MIRRNIVENAAGGQQINRLKLQQEWGLVGLLTVVVLLLRAAYVQWLHPYGLAPDEAQYWSWLAHNDWSFLTKPPLTTWLIGVSCAVFGNTLLGVKFFALAGQGAASVLGFAIAKEVGGQKAGWWAWVLLTTVPLLAAGGLIMSPDVVLTPLWLAALLSVVRGLKKPDDKALCWQRWVGIGIIVGLGGLAKYSAAFFYPLLGMYLLVWRREWLLRPQFWVSGVIALAFQAPVLIWNMHHHGVGMQHLLWQAEGSGDDYDGRIRGFLQFIGSQAGVLGPVVSGLMAFAAGLFGWKAYKDHGVVERLGAPRLFLMVVCGGILLGFAGLSFTAKVQANWPVLGTVTALVLLGIWLGQSVKKWVMWVAMFGVLLNGVASMMLMDTYKMRDLGILPLKAKIDPTKDLRGWAHMGELVGLLMYKLDNPVILSSRYQTLAPLMFHTIGNPEFAYVNAEGRRANEYDLWPMPDLTNRLVVYVNEQNSLPEKVKGMFGQCEPWHTVATEEYGITTRKLSMWLCWNPTRTVAMR